MHMLPLILLGVAVILPIIAWLSPSTRPAVFWALTLLGVVMLASGAWIGLV